MKTKMNVDRMSKKRILEEVEKQWDELGFSKEDLPTLRTLLMEAKIEERIVFKPREDQEGTTFCPYCGTWLRPHKRTKRKPVKKVYFVLKCRKCGYKEALDEEKVKVIIIRKKPSSYKRSGKRRKVILRD